METASKTTEASHTIDNASHSVYNLVGGVLSTDRKDIGINQSSDSIVNCLDPIKLKIISSERITVNIFTDKRADEITIFEHESERITFNYLPKSEYKGDHPEDGLYVGKSIFIKGGVKNSTIVSN